MYQLLWENLINIGREMPHLADATLKGSCIVLAAWLLTLLLRRRSAAMRYGVWLLALCSFVAIPAASLVLPQWRVLPGIETALTVNNASTPARAERTSNAGPVVVPHTTDAAQLPLVAADVQTFDHAPPPAISNPVASGSTLPTSQSGGALATLSTALLTNGTFVWVAGLCVLLLPVPISYLRLRRLEARATAKTDSVWQQLVSDCARRIGLRRPVKLFESSDCSMPMTWGLLRPRILLPSAVSGWSIERRQAVLLHELAHVKRFDCGTYLIARLICGVYWFNPLAWFALSRLAAERERACDDVVVSSGASAPDYAEDLLFVAAAPSRSLGAPCAVGMARRSRLEGRLLAILNPRTDHGPLSRRALGLLLTAAVLVVAPLAVLSSGANEPVIADEGNNAPQPSNSATLNLTPRNNGDQAAPAVPSSTRPAAPAPPNAKANASEALRITVIDEGHVTIDGKRLTLDEMNKTIIAKGDKLGDVHLRAPRNVPYASAMQVFENIRQNARSENVRYYVTVESTPPFPPFVREPQPDDTRPALSPALTPRTAVDQPAPALASAAQPVPQVPSTAETNASEPLRITILDGAHVMIEGERLTLDEMAKTLTAKGGDIGKVEVRAARNLAISAVVQVLQSMPKHVNFSIGTAPDPPVSDEVYVYIIDDQHVNFEGRLLTFDELSRTARARLAFANYVRILQGPGTSEVTRKKVMDAFRNRIREDARFVFETTNAMPAVRAPGAVVSPGLPPPVLLASRTPYSPPDRANAPVRIVILPEARLVVGKRIIAEQDLSNYLENEILVFTAPVPAELFEQAAKGDDVVRELNNRLRVAESEAPAKTADIRKQLAARSQALLREMRRAASRNSSSLPVIELVAAKETTRADISRVIDTLEANHLTRYTLERSSKPASALLPGHTIQIHLSPEAITTSDMSDVQLRVKITNAGRP